MQRRIWAVLFAGAVALGGCTGSPSVTEAARVGAGPTDSDTPAAEASPGAAPATEDARPEAPEASEAATGVDDDDSGATGRQAVVADGDPERTGPPDAAADDEAAGEVESGDDRNARDGAASKPRALAAAGAGDTGAKVEKLQARLARFGFAPGPVDGAYGPRTEAAVKAFQMITGLERTGRADAQTVAALEDYESDVRLLEAGDTGGAVKKLQKRLAAGPFDPGPVDGSYGTKTVQAVWALEKLAGVPVDGNWGPLDEHALARFEDGRIGRPKRRHDRRWVEFDLSQQVMKVYDPGAARPVLVSHGSSGSGIPWSNEDHSGSSVTPPGAFVISRRIAGWRESSLDIGRLYNPLYFNGGIAFHGALSVPLYPASHGCVRLPMHIAEYLPGELPDGTPVHVLR